MMKKIELLSPAGDPEKLRMAINYGADAVYLGGENFGLRVASKNFTDKDLEEGVKFAHSCGKKIYVTVNIIPHNEDFEGLERYLVFLRNAGVDALLISDPGILEIANAVIPQMEKHLSTQANCTNISSALFWHRQGFKRIVLARELSLKEIKEMRVALPETLSLEAFVHGAMCISYSGRCLLSSFLTGHDSNRGACKHPCRWKYSLVEEKRPGEYFPVIEDGNRTFILNSKDLCMIEHIPELIEAGIESLKIEGRVKTAYYTAAVTRAYRLAIDNYLENPEKHEPDPVWLEEVKKASNREFTTGFYFGKPSEEAQNYKKSIYINDYVYCGLIKGFDQSDRRALVQQKNKMVKGDRVEIIGPYLKKAIYTKIMAIFGEDGIEIESAPHPEQIVNILFEGEPALCESFMIRKKAHE